MVLKALLCCATLLSVVSAAHAQSEAAPPVLKFTTLSRAMGSATSIALGKNGVLYGTAETPGHCTGHIFSLTPPKPPATAWTHKTLRSFNCNGGTGEPADLNDLFIDGDGTIYGTSAGGGGNGTPFGHGTIFSLTRNKTNPQNWDFHPLHRFNDNGKGIVPLAGLIKRNGVFYGTTSQSNAASAKHGTVFSFVPPNGSNPAEHKVLHVFSGQLDGGAPRGRLLFHNGALFGTTSLNGRWGGGTAFKLTATSGIPGWKHETLAQFTGASGSTPWSGLVVLKGSTLIGTTASGVDNDNSGGMFSLTPPGKPVVIFKAAESTAGTLIYDEPLVDSTGAIYVTATYGGQKGGGSLIRLVAKPPATLWHATILHSYKWCENAECGPAGPIVADAKGNLFGASKLDGVYQVAGSGFKP